MKTLVILSGGLDSTTLFYYLRSLGHDVSAVGFYYGQRHRKELDAAALTCDKFGIAYPIVNLKHLGGMLKGNSQTDKAVAVPHGHYEAENMKLTVVPNRNMVMLAAAGAVAIANGCNAIAYGAHAGDHAIYPDCRPAFVQKMREALALCDWNPLQLLTPFVAWTKGDIVKAGIVLGVPYEQTWTCYAGGTNPCGLCGACIERAEAFACAGAVDPLLQK